MTFPSGNPWIFHRDEIDLLEEEMDAIYEHSQHAPEDPVSQMEDRILHEQIELEERLEAEFALGVDPEHFLRHALPSVEPELDLEETALPSADLKDLLRIHVERDPLYEAIFLWVNQVFLYVQGRYVKEQMHSEDFFRVYASVKMIPIKLSGVQVDPTNQDAFSTQMAKKEAQLCLMYFTRTLASLQHISFLGDERASVFLKQGMILEQAVRAELKRGKIL